MAVLQFLKEGPRKDLVKLEQIKDLVKMFKEIIKNQRAVKSFQGIYQRGPKLAAQVRQMKKEEVNLENERSSSLLFRILTRYV